MEERITKIYNACWRNYKLYLSDHDMEQYNKRSEKLFREYDGKAISRICYFGLRRL